MVKLSYSLPYTWLIYIFQQDSSGHISREKRVKTVCLLIKFSVLLKKILGFSGLLLLFNGGDEILDISAKYSNELSCTPVFA